MAPLQQEFHKDVKYSLAVLVCASVTHFSADLWKKRLHQGSADTATASKGKGTASTPAGSALHSRPVGSTQLSTAPGTFVSASSLGSRAAPSQSHAGHSQHDVSVSDHGVGISHQGKKRQTAAERYGRLRRHQAEESEVIDLLESPGETCQT